MDSSKILSLLPQDPSSSSTHAHTTPQAWILPRTSGPKLQMSFSARTFSPSLTAPIKDLPAEVWTLMLGPSDTLWREDLNFSAPNHFPRTLVCTMRGLAISLLSSKTKSLPQTLGNICVRKLEM